MRRKHSILIIDDTDFLPEAIANKLTQKGYDVNIVHTVTEGRNYLKRVEPPTFILADRILENGPIEVRDLVELCKEASAVSAEVLVYTDRDNLSKEKQYEILKKGAYRVLNKEDVEKLKDDVDTLISDFDERAELADELNADSSEERSKFITALIGADVSLSVLDDKYRHRYSKSAPQHLDQTAHEYPGRAVPDRSGICQNQCWLAQFHAPAVQHKCWGCTVDAVFKTGTTVEGLFLNRQSNGSVGWVDVQSKPIKSPTTGNTIAVREAVAAASDVALSHLALERRLQLIAESLIRAGFGRARIYTFDSGAEIATLRAAAAFSDDPLSPKSSYFESISSLNLDPSAHPYAKQAHENRIGSFVTEWNAKDATPLSARLDLLPPYFDVPIYREDRSLHSWLSVDFVGMEEPLRKKAIDHYARIESLTWLREEYGREIRLADDTEGKQGIREKFEIVRQARFGISNAKSVDDAVEQITSAFRALLPECRVTVRIKKESELQEFGRLCWHGADVESGPKSSLEDPRSLAGAVAKRPLPVWISDYPEYVEKAKQSGEPVGYMPEGTQSAAELPLRLENILLGTLGISSPTSFQWEADGYKEPLIALTKEVALVLRDLALHEEIDNAMNDRAAMIAYSVSVSADGLWRHWAQQRLSEISARVALVRTMVGNQALQPAELITHLKEISSVIEKVQSNQLRKDARQKSSIRTVFARLQEIYADKQPRPSFSRCGNEILEVPEFVLRNILMILLDNALRSIQDSRQGNNVTVNAYHEEGILKIDVVDDGPGITTEEQTRIFREPVASVRGQGLGLLYARGAALQYRGDLTFTSTPKVTRFTLKLPVTESAEEADV